jgi:YHS domain-containing protein
MKVWRLLAIAVLAVALLALIGCGKKEQEPATQQQEETSTTQAAVVDHTPTGDEIGTEATCAVCGMTVTVEATTPSVTYEGKNYYFWSQGDKEAFVANPQMFTEKAADTTGQTEEKTGQ